MYRRFFKRFIDIIFSGSALLVLSPVFLILALSLYFCNEGAGIFFFQERPGLKGRIFRIAKFKTMTDRRGPDGQLLPDSQRMTRPGTFLRNFSLDELPQLWNVLKGDMSLIGPRPLLPSYLPLYSNEQMRRHDIRPGITGWAQCHGRNNISWTEKFKLDVWYVDNLSFATDFKVILTTIKKVIRKEDINNAEASCGTMEPFNGHN